MTTVVSPEQAAVAVAEIRDEMKRAETKAIGILTAAGVLGALAAVGLSQGGLGPTSQFLAGGAAVSLTAGMVLCLLVGWPATANRDHGWPRWAVEGLTPANAPGSGSDTARAKYLAGRAEEMFNRARWATAAMIVAVVLASAALFVRALGG